MIDDAGQTEIQDYGEILSTPVGGCLPLIVGGQAVNVWALLQGEELFTELRQRDLLPLTSKDLDLHGNLDLLTELHRKFGGSVVLSRERSPVIGKIQINLRQKLLNIEILRDVLGMTAHDLENDSLSVDFDGSAIRIPTPTLLLKAKMANASRLDQSGRNDVRHVRIMILVTSRKSGRVRFWWRFRVRRSRTL